MAAVTFVAAGALAVNITNQTLVITPPAGMRVGDIMIAQLINKALTVAISPPDSSWTELYQANGDCTTAADDHRAALYWRAVKEGDPTTFSFTKASGTVLFAGVISAWRGADIFRPIDKAGLTSQVNAAANDNVTFPAYDPRSARAHVLFFAYYGNDLTTFAAAMSADTDPDCTTRYDLESASGNDCSLACTSGDTVSAGNIASRTWASASTADAGSTALVVALVPRGPFHEPYKHVRVGNGMSVTDKVR